MSLPVDIRVVGDKAVIANFDQIKGRAGNMSPAFKSIASMMIKSHQYNFKSHGATFGSSWPSRKLTYPWEILHKTGKLSRGFQSTSTSTSATVVNSVSYAKFHQLGTRKMPRRGIVGIEDGKTQAEVGRILNSYLKIQGGSNV